MSRSESGSGAGRVGTEPKPESESESKPDPESNPGADPGSPSSLVGAAVEVGVYALTVSLWITASAIAVGIGSGTGVIAAKNALFVLGWLAFGVVAIQLFPTGYDGGTGSTHRSRIDAAVARFPPLRWYWDERHDERATPLARRFGAAVAVLASSAVMEFGFGVGT